MSPSGGNSKGRSAEIFCRATSGFANSVAASASQPLGTMFARFVRYESGHRYFKRFERTIRSSHATPARGFSTIRRTSTIHSKQSEGLLLRVVVAGVVTRSPARVQLDVVRWVESDSNIPPLPIPGIIRGFVTDKVLVLEVLHDLVADVPKLEGPASW